MLYLSSIMDVNSYLTGSLNLVYELPEDGTDVPKHVGLVKHLALNVVVTCAYIGLINEYKIRRSNGDAANIYVKPSRV
jgi:hypothetical protein